MSVLSPTGAMQLVDVCSWSLGGCWGWLVLRSPPWPARTLSRWPSSGMELLGRSRPSRPQTARAGCWGHGGVGQGCATDVGRRSPQSLARRFGVLPAFRRRADRAVPGRAHKKRFGYLSGRADRSESASPSPSPRSSDGRRRGRHVPRGAPCLSGKSPPPKPRAPRRGEPSRRSCRRPGRTH